MRHANTYQLRPVTLAILLLTAFFCAKTQAWSQQPYQFENYTSVNGLSDNRITCIYKDKTGFMWVGTENGLNRFDGQHFLVYYPGGSVRNISHPYINDIAEDANNRLWVATQNGLNIIDTRAGTSAVLLPAEGRKLPREKNIPSNLIWDSYIDSSNRVWLAADARDLCYYDTKRELFVYYPWLDYIKSTFPHRRNSYNSIRKIYYKSADELWLGTAAGLFSFTISTGRFTQHPGREEDHFIQLQASADGRQVYFVQNPGNVLQVLSVSSGEKKEIPWSTVPLSPLTNISAGGEKHWLPAGKDLLEIDVSSEKISRIAHETDNPYSLPKGLIRTVYQDESGLVWVGTDAGLARFNPHLDMFRFNPVWAPTEAGADYERDLFRIDHKVHTVFYSSADNNYYISSPAYNCLVIMNRSTGKKEVIYKISNIPLTNCSVIYEDRQGMLWILANQHAFQYDRRTKKFIVSAFRCSAKNTIMTDMTEDSSGNFWIASFNDGLYEFSTESHQTTKLVKEGKSISAFPTGLYFDPHFKQLWISTFSFGMIRYDLNNKSFQYFIQSSVPGQIHASLITDVAADKKGNIWMSSYAGGLIVCPPNAKTDQFRHISAGEGLPENNIYSLAADSTGRIWGTSSKGLFSIDETDEQIRLYDRGSGLGHTDFYGPLTLSGNGQFYTGVDNGFIGFFPDSSSYPTAPFPVAITRISTKVTGEINSGQLSRSLVLTHDNNGIEFEFAALSYFQPAKTRYQYQLNGFDSNWIDNGQQTIVKYNNLAPGDYVFRIRAADFTGRPSANEAVVSFRLSPPWWQTWWFRVTLGLVLTSLAIYFYRLRIRTLKEKAAVQLRMLTLKEEALRAQMNPHFIFNSLNAIQELIITGNYNSSYEYLSKFSKLMRLVLNLSEKNLIPLSGEIEMCRLYLELESLRFKHSFQYQISYPSELDIDGIQFPTLLLQPFLENAIWHGLMNKEGEKELEIRFEEQNENLICSIRDNGIGREKAAAIKAEKIAANRSDSRGILLARQRMELLNAAGPVRGSIAITDCRDDAGNAMGTRVTIVISPEKMKP